MSDREDFEALKETIRQLPDSELKALRMPMGVYLQEATDLLAWIETDRAPLEAAGFDWALAQGLSLRIGAARYAQSRWNTTRFSREEAQQVWAEQSPEGYELRDNLVHHFLFAYRRQPDTQGRVRSIAEGTGAADMLQDLSDLAVLGRDNPKPLTAIRLDFSQLNRAEELCESLSGVLSSARGETATDDEAKRDRDRSYSYLKIAVDEIREYGRYVFWRDNTRIKGYASNYYRRQKQTRAAERDGQ